MERIGQDRRNPTDDGASRFGARLRRYIFEHVVKGVGGRCGLGARLSPHQLVEKLLDGGRRQQRQRVLKHFGHDAPQVVHDGAVIQTVVGRERGQRLLQHALKAELVQSGPIDREVGQNDGLRRYPSESSGIADAVVVNIQLNQAATTDDYLLAHWLQNLGESSATPGVADDRLARAQPILSSLLIVKSNNFN